MPSRSSRNFTILDGMILVAVLAGAIAMRRAAWDGIARHGFIGYTGFRKFGDAAIEEGFPFLVALTPAVLAMRLRRPRPRWRLLLRQPGTAACVAAMIPLATSLYGLWDLARFLEHPVSELPAGVGGASSFGSIIRMPPLGDIEVVYGTTIGLWVLGAWLVLRLSGRRRPERSWIDLLGRLVGLGWVLMVPMKILLAGA
jgi:hypothetical protein